jgi:predicted RNA-binding Zn-ribbon protein involved in translation (DUF1610 family)
MVEFEKSFRLGLADLPGMSFSCPRCGSALILRTARKGRNRGSQFWGCTAWPSCGYTADLGVMRSSPGCGSAGARRSA